MATVIRLQRGGRKNLAYYRIMVADSVMKRDGRFLEQVGTYDPTSDPAKVTLDERAVRHWLDRGARPSDTVRSILRRHGLLAHRAVATKDEPAAKAPAAVKPVLLEGQN